MDSLSFDKNLSNNYTNGKLYDICVITSANEYQAHGYRKQLKWRIENESLPKETRYFVISDPNGQRIGSGGSTIYVLYKLSEYLYKENPNCQSPYELFKGKRILILHSGGDSKRIPAYSAIGKIFMPLPTEFSSICQQEECRNSVFISILELILGNLMLLPYLDEGQVIIASGDVLLSFDPSEIIFSKYGITGLAYPDNIETASNHGVYIIDQCHHFGICEPKLVKDFIQKPSCDELESCNGFDPAKRAFVDTGVMNFGIDVIKAIMDMSGIIIKKDLVSIEKDSLCESLINSKAQLDIYKEIPYAVLGKNHISDYYPSLNNLRNMQFFVNILPFCEFFHLGTSKHLIQNFHTVNYTSSTYRFQNFSKTKVLDKTGLTNAFVYNSIINTSGIYSEGSCFIEGCHLNGKILLGGENILTGILNNHDKIDLQYGICLTNVPVIYNENGWVSIIYGIDDNFKKNLNDNDITFLNQSFTNWMDKNDIEISDLWDCNERHELWNAKLFPFDKNASEAMNVSLILQKGDKNQISEWRKSCRLSLKEILESMDYEEFFRIYSDLCKEINLNNIANIIIKEDNLSSDEILSWCVERKDYQIALDNIFSLLKNTNNKKAQRTVKDNHSKKGKNKKK
ncbi:TPA: hypothetical protein ENS27_03910 [bacterium]|nr:hypothetical protein [bacterium]